MRQVGCVYPSKNLSAYGDGGMLTTNDAALVERLAAPRVHGATRKYYHYWIGVNSRLDTLQAAALRVKLRHLDRWSEGRQRNALRYRKLLAEPGAPARVPQPAVYQTRHMWNQFVICAPEYDRLPMPCSFMCFCSHPLPLQLRTYFAHLGHKPGDFLLSERLAAESLALPVHSELSADDIEYVCRAIRAFYA